MVITSIKTPRIEPRSCNLLALLDSSLPQLTSNCVIAITSKVVSLCEGSVVDMAGTDKTELVRAQADLYVADAPSKWGFNYTIKNNTLIPSAGIDESNAGDVYVLWPKDAQATANLVRQHLVTKHNVSNLGVIITDSTCRPLRRGVSGIALGFSGFKPLHDYVGTADLFDRPFKVSQADIVGGLAAAAVLEMGEGAESTPIVLMTDVAAAEFVSRDPTAAELAVFNVTLAEDLFAPFLEQANWQKGGATN